MSGSRWLAHSRIVWFISAIDGTKYRTRPPMPARRSAIHSALVDAADGVGLGLDRAQTATRLVGPERGGRCFRDRIVFAETVERILGFDFFVGQQRRPEVADESHDRRSFTWSSCRSSYFQTGCMPHALVQVGSEAVLQVDPERIRDLGGVVRSAHVRALRLSG